MQKNIKAMGQRSLLFVAVLAGLSGCSALHTAYERPELPEYVFAHGTGDAGIADAVTVADIKTTETQGLAKAEELNPDFWVGFGDDKLTAIIEDVLAHGGDYRTAVLTAQKALKQADITATNLIPDIGAELGSNLSKSFSGGGTRRSSSSALRVSYELDLFGRLSAERKEQSYSAMAQVNDAKTARLSVAAEVANLYWQIVYTRDALRLDEASLADSRRTYEIMESRYETGKVSKLELLQAKKDLVEQESTLAKDKATLTTSISALNAMRNAVPDAPIETADSLNGLSVPLLSLERGSALLNARPDIRAAEERLRSALAKKDAARLDMYPRLSLSAGISAGSTNELYQFFRDPLGSLAAALSFPFLNYYQNSLQVDVAGLDRDSAELKFVSAYYLALSEVSQAQTNLNLDDAVLAHDRERYQLTLGTEEIYRTRYEAGKVALKDYLESRSARRIAEKAVLGDLKGKLNDTVVLAKALGGI